MNPPILAILAAIIIAMISAAPAFATNHTVGGNAGWFFDYDTNTAVTDYTAWAATQSFYLGDYLIFNSNSNMTIVQTYNSTTYSLCTFGEDDSNQTSVYGDSNNLGLGVPGTLALPLTVEGPNYYFSDPGDSGVQCLAGMHFKITVASGQDQSPPGTSQPAGSPPDAGTPPAGTPPDAGTPPVTAVSSSPSSTKTPPQSMASPGSATTGSLFHSGAAAGPETMALGFIFSAALGVLGFFVL